MARVNLNQPPFYDNGINEFNQKNYKQVVFNTQVAVQNRELTAIGTYAKETLKTLADTIYSNGKIISGCEIANIDITNKNLTMKPGKIYIDGHIHTIDPDLNPNVSLILPIKTEGTEKVCVEIIEELVGAMGIGGDVTLKDPAIGTDNYGYEGASRLKIWCKYITTSSPEYDKNNKNYFVIKELKDGVEIKTNQIITEQDKPIVENVDDKISKSFVNVLGDYVVSGFRSRDSFNNEVLNRLCVEVDGGEAFLAGTPISITEKSYFYPQILRYDYAIYNELHLINKNGEELENYSYITDQTPITNVIRISAPVLDKNENMQYSTGDNVNLPSGYTLKSVIEVKDTGQSYQINVDYSVAITPTGFRINWIPSGVHPTGTYEVKYVYNRILDDNEYTLEYIGSNNIKNTYEVKNGIVTLPVTHYNIHVKSITLTDGTSLVNGRDYYVIGNQIFFNSSERPLLLKEYRKTDNINYDTLSDIATTDIINTIKSNNIYNKKEYFVKNDGNTNYDYEIKNNNEIHWNIPEEYNDLFRYTVTLFTRSNKKIKNVIIDYLYETFEEAKQPDTTYKSKITIKRKIFANNSLGDNSFVISTSYKFGKTRYDSVILTFSGAIDYNYGISENINSNYITPINPKNCLPIAEIMIKPIATTTIHKCLIRYGLKMNDILDVKDRVDILEYNVAMTDLEKIAEKKSNKTSLKGIVTDNFDTLKRHDHLESFNKTNNELNVAIPNVVEECLFPNFKKVNLNCSIDYDTTTAGRFESTYLLHSKITPELWITQPYGSKWRSLCEGYNAQSFNTPEITITPDADYFQNDTYLQSSSNVAYSVVNINGNGALMSDNLTSTALDGDFTIQTWHKATNKSYSQIFGFYHTNNIQEPKFKFCLINNNLFLEYSDTSTGNGRLDFGILETSDVWNHFTLTFDKTKKEITLFINGNKKIGFKLEDSIYNLVSNISYFSIGGKYKQENPQLVLASQPIYSSGSFSIIECRIWKGVLSDTEISNNILKKATDTDTNILKIYPLSTDYNGFIKESTVEFKVDKTFGAFNTSQPFELVLNNAADISLGSKPAPVVDVNITKTNSYTTKELANTSTSTTTSTRPNSGTGSAFGSATSTYTTTTTTKTYNVFNNDVMKKETNTTSFTQKTVGENVQTLDFITGLETALVLREIEIKIQGSGFIPNTNYIECYFDNKKVDLREPILSGEKIGEMVDNGCYKCDSNGQFIAYIIVPPNTPVGNREIRIEYPGGEPIKTTFWGAGIKSNKIKSTIKTPIQAWVASESTQVQNYVEKTLSHVDKETTTNTVCSSDCNRCNRCNHCNNVPCSHCSHCSNCTNKPCSNCQNTPPKPCSNVISKPRPVQILPDPPAPKPCFKLAPPCPHKKPAPPRPCGHCNDDDRSGGGYKDPLVQTIYTNELNRFNPILENVQNGSNVFVVATDVYFRNVVNGTKIYFSFIPLLDSGVPGVTTGGDVDFTKEKFITFLADNANISDGDISVGSARTRVSWISNEHYKTPFSSQHYENGVPQILEGNKGYGLAVGSHFGDNLAWVAEIGERDVLSGERIINEPDRGVLLSSPNLRNWTTYIKEDLKYNVYVANFWKDNSDLIDINYNGSDGKLSYINYKPIMASENDLEHINFFNYELNTFDSKDGLSYIKYEYSETIDGNNWLDWKPFSNSVNTYLTQAAKGIKIRVALMSFSMYSSPMVSQYSGISLGQFVLPSYYTSYNSIFSKYNTIDTYFNRLNNNSKADYDLEYSVNGGFFWNSIRDPEINEMLESENVNDNGSVKQLHYQTKLYLKKPTIIELKEVKDSSGVFVHEEDYTHHFAVVTLDEEGRETELSNIESITSTENFNIELSVKFDIASFGYRVYCAKCKDGETKVFKRIYDSSLSGLLSEPISLTNSGKILMNVTDFDKFKNLLPTEKDFIIRIGEENILITFKDDGFDIKTRGANHTPKSTHTKGEILFFGNDGYAMNLSPMALSNYPYCFPLEKYQYSEEFKQIFNANNIKENILTTSTETPTFDIYNKPRYEATNFKYRITLKDKENSTSVKNIEDLPNFFKLMFITTKDVI